MLVVAAWIAAAEARGTVLPAAHFSDPLDDALASLGGSGQAASATVERVFRLASFADDQPGRHALVSLAAAHLDRLRTIGAAAAMAAPLSGRAI